jgi:thioredoxin-dependent peroxiredoxin
MPEQGQPAPEFTGTTSDGASLSLSDLRGKPVALYFYPKDDTPGCTRQACSLRDGWDELQQAGIQVIGVSGDDEASHQRFADKFSLPFPLLADTDHEIQHKYGARGSKSMYGRIFDATKRVTFLIDREGTICHVFKRPDTSNHAREVLDKWRQIEKS